MSGTSCDGISSALIERPRAGALRLLGYRTDPYPAALRRRLRAAAENAEADEVGALGTVLGRRLADAALALLRQAGVAPSEVAAIGSHGHTLRHRPAGPPGRGARERFTLQIGEPSWIVERTGITTVSDFRPRDLAAGGEGAPLVPYLDWKLWTDPRRGRIALNLGGIANLTLLPAGATATEVLAFDTGPGNMVLDALAFHFSAGRRWFDRGGALAARGRSDARLLDALLRHPYFVRRPPKSCGREQFGSRFVADLLRRARRLPPADVMATALALTVESIARAIERFCLRRAAVEQLIVSGGGARNPTLLGGLARRLPALEVQTSAALGLPAEAKESVAFALLAEATLRGAPGNLPGATGARHAAPLGKILRSERL